LETVAVVLAWLSEQAPPTIAGFLGGVVAVLGWNIISNRRSSGRCSFCNGKLESNCRHIRAADLGLSHDTLGK